MVDRILAAAKKCSFDFRHFANPEDPLRNHFEQWVEYYRLKCAIAEVLQPRTILEIGVRYGYSAQAFLAGAPAAHYTGIDLDVDTFGGSANGLTFAREKLPSDAVLIRDNSQRLSQFPGGIYDLIHLDAQQDEAAIYHDLEMAVRQGKFILVDGYFWTKANFFAANDFILKHRDLIEYSLVIPGYAGELLLCIKEPMASAAQSSANAGSGPLRGLYNEHYYLKECGGWEFQQGIQKTLLEDARLRAVYNMAMVWPTHRLLDIGCGRGEICLHAARSGLTTLGIDYSEAAIAIARKNGAQDPAVGGRASWLCIDANSLPEDSKYDAIVISDVVEHLSPDEACTLFAKSSRLLSEGGKLAVHTFPNLWFYKYDYARRRSEAAKLGAYLPAQPRSRFEREMHINECNPRWLRRALQKHFRHVRLWFGSPEEPLASLQNRFSPHQLAAQRDLFAIASNTPFELQPLISAYSTSRLTDQAAHGLSLMAEEHERECNVGEVLAVGVAVENQSGQTISSEKPWPVYLSYHWLRKADRDVIVFEGNRSRLTGAHPDGTKRYHVATVLAPAVAGEYILQITLIQEHVMWVNNIEPRAQVELDFSVKQKDKFHQ